MGFTPLCIAASCDVAPELARVLMEAGGDPNLSPVSPSSFHAAPTPLHMAARRDVQSPLLEVMLERADDGLELKIDGLRPVDVARLFGRSRVNLLLLETATWKRKQRAVFDTLFVVMGALPFLPIPSERATAATPLARFLARDGDLALIHRVAQMLVGTWAEL